MNHLAHFFLSFEQEPLLVGNYMADFALGSSYLEMHPNIQQGVLLHRFIDNFTDTHPSVQKSKKRVAKTQGKYAPVVVDVFYDHLLAFNWSKYCKEPLSSFATKTYQQLEHQKQLFPERLLLRFEHMKTHDWLSHYATKEGIERALAGLSKRAKFDNQMEYAFKTYILNKDALLEDFQSFFPEIIEATAIYIEEQLDVQLLKHNNVLWLEQNKNR